MLVRSHSYTFFIAPRNQGRIRKIRVPAFILHLLAVLAIVGGAAAVAALGSYSRMLWRLADYNALRREEDTLKRQNRQLQETVSDTNQRLSSLESLATEVAMTYGLMRFRQTEFGFSDVPVHPEAVYQRSMEQFNFLKKNPAAVVLAAGGLRLMRRPGLGDARFTPSLWPVIGHISGSFGERLDPFSGEGAFHTGVDISSEYGDPMRATADGVVVAVEARAGYGWLVVVDHPFGISTWYGHLSHATWNLCQARRCDWVRGHEWARDRTARSLRSTYPRHAGQSLAVSALRLGSRLGPCVFSNFERGLRV